MQHGGTAVIYKVIKSIAILLCFYLSSCVSVKLPQSGGEKSNKLKLESPGPAYRELFLKDLDFAWRNDNTSSTISVYSECLEENPQSLKEIRRDLISSLSGSEILSESSSAKGELKSLRSSVMSRLDNQKTYTDLAIYNKDKCIYAASHVTLNPQAAKEVFSEFLSQLESQL